MDEHKPQPTPPTSIPSDELTKAQNRDQSQPVEEDLSNVVGGAAKEKPFTLDSVFIGASERQTL
jgi:hypothetical protein